MYNFLANHVLEKTQARIESVGLAFTLPPLGAAPGDLHDGSQPIKLIDDTYADDSCFFTPPADPIDMLRMFRVMAAIVVEVFAEHGLLLNFKCVSPPFTTERFPRILDAGQHPPLP